MNEKNAREISVPCKDENVAVTYANGMIVVNPPTRQICHGYTVHFHFAGPRGTADISPKDPADDPWLKKTGIAVPGQVDVDTSPSTPGVDHHYTVTIKARDADGTAIELIVDPIIRPI